MLLPFLCSLFAPQLDPPRFAEPFVDTGFGSRLEAPDPYWLALPRGDHWSHCGALVVDGIAVDLSAFSLADGTGPAPTMEESIEFFLPVLEFEGLDLRDLVERKDVEFAGTRAVDVVFPAVDPQMLFDFSFMDEDERAEVEYPFSALRVVDVDGVRFRFWTDPVDDAEAAMALLDDACAGWTFVEGPRPLRSDLAGLEFGGAGWRVAGRAVEDAATGLRTEVAPSLFVSDEPPWVPEVAETLVTFAPDIDESAGLMSALHVRRLLPPALDAEGRADWPERRDWDDRLDLAARMKEAWPAAQHVDVFQTPDGPDGDWLSTIVRLTFAEQPNAWLLVDIEFMAAHPETDVVKWSAFWLASGLGDWSPLPERTREELLGAARTEAMDVANRRWSGSVLRDAEVGLTWTAPEGLWQPGAPEAWAIGGPERFVAFSWSDGVTVTLDVRKDSSKSIERSLERALRRALGRRVSLEDVGTPRAIDAGPGTESLRIEIPDAFEDGDAALVQITKADRQRTTLVVRGSRARLDALRPVFGAVADGLRVDPEEAARAVELDDAGIVDRELGYAYDSPGEGWEVVEDATYLDDRTGGTGTAWQDPETEAWIAISATNIYGYDLEPFDALTHSSACARFEEGFERYSTTVAGLTCDVVGGVRDGLTTHVATWRRGSTAFSLTLGGETEQFDIVAALARFRTLD